MRYRAFTHHLQVGWLPARVGAGKFLRPVLCSVVCLVLLAILTVQALGLPRPQAFQKGLLGVEFGDGASPARQAPYFDVRGAYPGMPPISTAFSVHNAGSLPATYGLRVGEVGSSGRPLAEVLLVRVEGPTGSVVYQGDLAGMYFGVSKPLVPGAVDAFSVEVRWPDGGAEVDQYQGDWVWFRLLLNSESLSVRG